MKPYFKSLLIGAGVSGFLLVVAMSSLGAKESELPQTIESNHPLSDSETSPTEIPVVVVPQISTSLLTGRVTDNAGNPIRNAEVRVETVSDRYLALSNADGTFQVDEVVVNGEFVLADIRITATGFATWTYLDVAFYPDTAIEIWVQLSGELQVIEGRLPSALTGILDGEATGPVKDDYLALVPFYYSQDTLPTQIRVAITGHDDCASWETAGSPIQRVDTLSFRDYVKNVLPNEWIPSWESDSLKAGAMAVKMYAWFQINLNDGNTYDVVDNTCDQHYVPGSAIYSSSNNAVDETWHYIMRSDQQLVSIHYLSTDELCAAKPWERCMGQWGTQYLAQDGVDWQSILHYYYDPIQITLSEGTPTPEPGSEDIGLEIQPNQGRPTIRWDDDVDAEYYRVYIGNANYSVTVLDKWIAKNGALCAAGVCTFKPDINPVAGDYHVWLQWWGDGKFSTGGNSGHQGWWTTDFNLSNARPGPIEPLTATIDGSGAITLRWQGAEYATWYNVWVGTDGGANPPWQQHFFDWILAENLGCEYAGICTLTHGVALASGTTYNLNLSSGQYVWYVQSWGPGGFSTGGIAAAPGWVQAPNFTVP